MWYKCDECGSYFLREKVEIIRNGQTSYILCFNCFYNWVETEIMQDNKMKENATTLLNA